MIIKDYSYKVQLGAGGDDLTVTHHQSPVVQSNNYYPFGMQHATSWTRNTTLKNNCLYNAGAELNEHTKNYETFYRQYDPALGRFTAIDPLATKYTSTTPYNYAFNDPIALNDSLGDDPANCIVCNRTNYSTTLEQMRAGDSDLASRGQSLISYGGITGEQYDQMQKDAKELSPAEFAKKYGVSISIFDILKWNPHGGKNNVTLEEWLENDGNYDQYKAKLASGEEPYLDLGAWEINLSNVVVDQSGGTDPYGLMADLIRNVPYFGTSANPFFGAVAIFGDFGGVSGGSESDIGSFFVLVGKNKGRFLSYGEIAPGIGNEFGGGIEIGRVDYTGDPNEFGLDKLKGIRQKSWLNIGPAGVGYSWSTVNNELVELKSLQIGAGIDDLLLWGVIGIGYNIGFTHIFKNK